MSIALAIWHGPGHVAKDMHVSISAVCMLTEESGRGSGSCGGEARSQQGGCAGRGATCQAPRAVAKAKKAAEPLQAVEHPSHQKVQMPMWKFYLMQMQPLYLWAMLWQTLVAAGTCLMMSDSLSTAGDVIGRCQRLLLVRGCD